MEISLQQIAAITGGTIEGDPGTVITGLAGIDEAGPGQIAFVANPKYAPCLATTRASAVICGPDDGPSPAALLRVPNPYLAYAKLVSAFNPPPDQPGTIAPEAHIGADVTLGSNVTVYPFAYIGDGCEIDDGVTIYPHCYIGPQCRIGAHTLLHPGVTIRERCRIGKRVIIHSGTVIGSDGFGYAKDGQHYFKIPQLGIVQIDDDVEIGACTTIDRAAIDRTWIQRGAKIDNLVQVAHNVVIGEDSAIVAQVGISGSTRLGARVTMAGQSAAVGHITIGDDVTVGARGAVVASLADRQVVSGAPAIDHKQNLRAILTLPKLPDMRQSLQKLQTRVAELEATLAALKENRT